MAESDPYKPYQHAPLVQFAKEFFGDICQHMVE